MNRTPMNTNLVKSPEVFSEFPGFWWIFVIRCACRLRIDSFCKVRWFCAWMGIVWLNWRSNGNCFRIDLQDAVEHLEESSASPWVCQSELWWTAPITLVSEWEWFGGWEAGNNFVLVSLPSRCQEPVRHCRPWNPWSFESSALCWCWRHVRRHRQEGKARAKEEGKRSKWVHSHYGTIKI